MNTTYDRHSVTLSIVLAPGEVAESEEDKPAAILDAAGNLVRREILDPSKTIPDLASINRRITV